MIVQLRDRAIVRDPKLQLHALNWSYCIYSLGGVHSRHIRPIKYETYTAAETYQGVNPGQTLLSGGKAMRTYPEP